MTMEVLHLIPGKAFTRKMHPSRIDSRDLFLLNEKWKNNFSRNDF